MDKTCPGMKVLVDGGNAVDSAVATALCQGVLNPMASGLGGGGFMVIRTAQGETKVIDAREVAPAAASENMFAGDTPSPRRYTHLHDKAVNDSLLLSLEKQSHLMAAYIYGYLW